MTTSAEVILSSDINYSVSEIRGNNTRRSESESIGHSLNWSFGTGVGQVNAFAKFSISVDGDEGAEIIFTGINKTYLGNTTNLNFNNIKGLIIKSTTELTNVEANLVKWIVTTDSSVVGFTIHNPLTQMFQRGVGTDSQGQVVIKPQGAFTYFNKFGLDITSSGNSLAVYLDSTDVSDQHTVDVLVVGVTGI